MAGDEEGASGSMENLGTPTVRSFLSGGCGKRMMLSPPRRERSDPAKRPRSSSHRALREPQRLQANGNRLPMLRSVNADETKETRCSSTSPSRGGSSSVPRDG